MISIDVALTGLGVMYLCIAISLEWIVEPALEYTDRVETRPKHRYSLFFGFAALLFFGFGSGWWPVSESVIVNVKWTVLLVMGVFGVYAFYQAITDLADPSLLSRNDPAE